MLTTAFCRHLCGEEQTHEQSHGWCGWTTSSLESSLPSMVAFGLDTSAANKDAKLESVQTEVFNQKQAQATWIALDCRSLTRLDRW